MGKFVISKTAQGEYWWVLKAENGETLIKSENYTTKQNCLSGIASSKQNVADEKFKRKISISNQPYFTQIANNYQTLGTSEMYSSTYQRDAGIESVKRNAPTATIEDRY